MSKKLTQKTKGQQMAEKARQLTNNATDDERQRLLAKGMSLIYQAKGAARAHRR